MHRRKMFIVITLMLVSTLNVTAQNREQVLKYIEKYRSLAMSEQQRTGIPAAIKLAQGIHETGAGTSELAVNANNHFGLKCKSSWTGATYQYTDDRPNECFRKYNLDFESYQDQSNYLKSNPRYASLFNISITDYAGWAFGLRKAGYATNAQYAHELIKLIEDYRLQEYTYAAMGNTSLVSDNVAAAPATNNTPSTTSKPQYREPVQQAPVQQPQATTAQQNSGWVSNRPAPSPVPATETYDNTPPQRTSKYIDTKPRNRQTIVRTNRNGKTVEEKVEDAPNTIVKVNNLKAVYAKRGDSPLPYAVRNGIRYEKFLEMNDLEDKPLPADMPLYLERKHFWGIRPMHLVKPYETMLVIAQQEGIQLKYLRDLNYIEPDEEPVPGVTLELQAQAGEKPQVVKRTSEEYQPPAEQMKEAQQLAEQPQYKFPKNPAPPHEEEKTILEKIKEAREARRKEKEAQSQAQARPILQPQQMTPAASQPAQQPQATQQPTESYSRQQYSNSNRYVTPNPAAQVPEEDDRKSKRRKEENQPVVTQPQPQQPQQPKSELDKLKEQFDNVIYADNNATSNNNRQQPTQRTAPQQQQSQPSTQYGSQPQTNTQYGQPQNSNNAQQKPQNYEPGKYYTVKAGDTAYTIAKKNGITIRQLMDMNGLDFDQIKEGQNLRVKP